MLKKRWVLIFLLTFANIIIYSQQSDFQTWYNIEVDGRINKMFEYSIAPEIRTWDNSSRIETMLCEISLSVPFAKHFDFGILYRPELDISEIYRKKINRFSIYADASYKIKRLRFSYRGMLEEQYTNYNTSENGHIADTWHRHKVAIKYNLKKSKISPFISTEAFFALSPAKDSQKRKLRTSFGFQYQINKNTNCSVAYKIQQDYNTKNPDTLYILSLSLEYSL